MTVITGALGKRILEIGILKAIGESVKKLGSSTSTNANSQIPLFSLSWEYYFIGIAVILIIFLLAVMFLDRGR